MDPKSIQALEYPKIIARLAALCAGPAGRALADQLEPSADYDEVLRRQGATAEARSLAKLKPSFALGSAPEVSDRINAASRGGALPPSDVAEVAALLRTARHARNHVAPLARELPQLAQIAQRIADFSDLIGQIDRTLDERGEVLDSASPELGPIRAEVRVAHDRLVAAIERIMRRAVSDGVAQEALVTERDGRYVIPLKAEARSSIPSVVHDVSASGATVFVEPLAVVEQGNRWREARLAEEHEIERIMRQLSIAIGAEAGAIQAALRAIAEIDLAMAKVRLGSELDAPLPVANDSLAWLVRIPQDLRLQSARHPLLSGDVVPISLAITQDARCVLITGPNTGGKTVALKTVGLLALMAQAGLPVPAELGTQLPVFEDVFADIGDEQSIEQSLSTFSAHMTNIIRILDEASESTLVLLDELGAGTDPTEGSALGRAILGHLLDLDAAVVATTHHSELKVFAHSNDGVVNASVEFNSETLQPTYKLLMGTPGRSNAIAIADRLGMPPAVLDRARSAAAPSEASIEDLLETLQRERDTLTDARRAEEHARAEAEEIREQLGRRREEIENERDALIARTERTLEEELSAARRELREAERELRKRSRGAAAAARALADDAAQRLEGVREERARTRRRRAGPQAPPDPTGIGVGDYIYLQGLSEPGEVLEAVADDGTLEVQLGALRTRVRADQVERLAPSRESAQSQPSVVLPAPPLDPGSRIEVRGQTLDEAMPAVEDFLDRAYRAGQQRLEIVHGKGTGTLRAAVRRLLRDHPLVSSFEPGSRHEGGEGVTIVQMVR